MPSDEEHSVPTQQEQNAMIQGLLDKSYECLFEGEKDGALAAVINAIILLKGENAVLGIIDQVKAQMKRRIDEMYDENNGMGGGIDLETALKMCDDLFEQNTILAERGDENILVEAFQDGSSVVCNKCNALIPVVRIEPHRLYWCEAIDDEEEGPMKG